MEVMLTLAVPDVTGVTHLCPVTHSSLPENTFLAAVPAGFESNRFGSNSDVLRGIGLGVGAVPQPSHQGAAAQRRVGWIWVTGVREQILDLFRSHDRV